MAHTILLVDDVVSNLMILEKILAGEGFHCVRATSGVEALTLIETEPVSVVLLDVQMPDMDGCEVARRIRARGNTAGLPIIFITASATAEEAVFDGYDAGAIDYLVKPVHSRILCRKVQQLCDLVEQERELKRLYAEAESRNAELERLLAQSRQLEEARMESEARYRSLIALSPIPILVQVDGGIVYHNASASRLLGLASEAEARGLPFHAFVEESGRAMVGAQIEEIARCGGQSDPIGCRLIGGNYVELSIGCILYDDEVGVQMAIQDVTAHKLLQDELARLSQIDGLTGVANRRHLDEALPLECKRAQRAGAPLSFLMFDIDQFKPYNDHYGHQAGDECLKRVAEALGNTASRPGDLVARYGGEEFVAILPNTDLAGARHIGEMAVEAVRALQIPHVASRNGGCVTISAGIATLSPGGGGAAPADLVRRADQALYRRKQAGGDGCHLDPASAGA